MKDLVKRFLRQCGVHLYTSDSLPCGVDWLHDIRRHGRMPRAATPLCLDVGANVGQTVQAILQAFPNASIHAFEPFAEPLRLLRQRVERLPRVRVVPAALGSMDGVAMVQAQARSELNTLRHAHAETGASAEAAAGQERIDIQTLDGYCRRAGIGAVDILKIDTEGYDVEVLRGGLEGLQQAAFRYIYVEVTFLDANANNTPFEQVFALLQRHGYRLLGIYETYSMHHFPAPNHFCNALFVAPEQAAGRT